MRDNLEYVLRQSGHHAALLDESVFDALPHKYCAGCTESIKLIYDSERNVTWEKLPEYFDLLPPPQENVENVQQQPTE